MNKLKITLAGKELSLRFGMICWEQFSKNLKEHNCLGTTRSLANLVHSAIVNEEEITGVSQGITFDDLVLLVDEAGATDEGNKFLHQAEALFQEHAEYKRVMAIVAEADKKKESVVKAKKK